MFRHVQQISDERKYTKCEFPRNDMSLAFCVFTSSPHTVLFKRSRTLDFCDTKFAEYKLKFYFAFETKEATSVQIYSVGQGKDCRLLKNSSSNFPNGVL